MTSVLQPLVALARTWSGRALLVGALALGGAAAFSGAASMVCAAIGVVLLAAGLALRLHHIERSAARLARTVAVLENRIRHDEKRLGDRLASAESTLAVTERNMTRLEAHSEQLAADLRSTSMAIVAVQSDMSAAGERSDELARTKASASALIHLAERLDAQIVRIDKQNVALDGARDQLRHMPRRLADIESAAARAEAIVQPVLARRAWTSTTQPPGVFPELELANKVDIAPQSAPLEA